MMKKKDAYGLGVFGFGMVSLGQMSPVLLGDTSLSNWHFVGINLTVFTAVFCAYKSFGLKTEADDAPSEGKSR